MADYTFKYRLESAPSTRRDGSRMVSHRIVPIYRDVTAAPQDPWLDVPGRRKDILIPADDLAIVLAGPQITTKYKQALVDNVNTGATPVVGWDLASLEEMIDNNDASDEQSAAANEYITVTLGLNYPVDFQI